MPDDIPLGVAEILITVQEQQVAAPGNVELMRFLDSLDDMPQTTRTEEEIEREIEAERNSWE